MVGFLKKMGMGSSPSPSSSASSLAMGAAMKPAGNLRRKPGGWKTMPFILGNETFERLASFSLLANFMVYLKREYSMDQVSASNLINTWTGFSNFAPLLGAFLSDAYFGRFPVIAFASFAGFTGMVVLTLTAWIPSLRPNCSIRSGHCTGPNSAQLGILILSLVLLSVGTGGIRPCSIPFGVDQFDFTTEEGRRGINSYYNWYYTTFTVVVMLALTVMVYVQDNYSWVIGFGIPTILMLASIVLFFIGTRRYVYVKPEGSIFSGVAQVLVAAFRKRRLHLPADDGEKLTSMYYDPPLQGILVSKLPLSNEFRLLNKAAIMEEGEEVNPESNKWRVSSIQQIEEVKCLIRVLPVWASGIVCFTAAIQQFTFTVSQALVMDRHLARGSNFKIPAGSMAVISMLAIGVWVPIYDRFIVPLLQRVTHREGGITLLQRMGIGLVFSVSAMLVAGAIEKHRRDYTLAHHRPLSVLWLAPQLILMGLAEAFNFIAQIEFYNKQFPENMRSIATSLFFCTIAGASYLSTFITTLIHNYTGGNSPSKHEWLDDNLDLGRLDYFYYLLAVLGGLNIIYFLVVSSRYRYKSVQLEKKPSEHNDLELTSANT